MTKPIELLRGAAKSALRFRVKHGYQLDEPCDIYELVGKQRLDLQFVDIPSLEGMYLEEVETNRICVCAHRPVGRQKFTVAHELGHHLLGHGTQIDAGFELGGTIPNDLEERTADVFARYLLMPPRAVHAGFQRRGLDPSTATPEDFYSVSSWLGVGYLTLVQHMAFTLRTLSNDRCHELEKKPLKQVKTSLVGVPTVSDVWRLDDPWANLTVHAQIGDFILGVPAGQDDTRVLKSSGDACCVAATVGTDSRLLTGGGVVRICVSRRNFVGFYEYRYMRE